MPPVIQSIPTPAALGTQPVSTEVASPSPMVAEPKKYPLGTVFAKTVFDGVVKTSYVQLSIVDVSAPEKNYELYIGDKARQQNFPWDVQTVRPGYFFIDLPAGTYRIRSMTIPVATTLATEPMNVVFDVIEGKTVYLGTLQVLGVGEKIKLGGVPIIRPGFDYSVHILDERAEAMTEWQQRLPEKTGEVVPRLMQVYPVAPQDIPLSR